MAAWQPTAEGLQQLLGLFKATQGADNEQHRNIFEQLRSFNAVPDYNCYLAFILNQMRQEETAVRQTAGLVLKNNITQHWASVAPEVQQYVLGELKAMREAARRGRAELRCRRNLGRQLSKVKVQQ